MAYFTNYIRAPLQSQAMPDFSQEAAQAYRNAQLPRWLQSKQKILDLENQSRSIKNQYAPELWQGRLQQLGLANQAATENLKFLPEMMQEKLRGLDLGNQLASEKLKYLPDVMQAKLNAINNPKLSGNALSPLGKLIRERTNVEHLISPDGTSALDPSTAVQLLNLYDAQMLKNTTDAVTRKRLGYANQMDITLNSIKGSILTQYSGPAGKAQLVADKAAALNGNAPERYQKYMKNVELAQEFAKQYRQFAGDSVQPSNFKRIEQLVNPSSWTTDPDTAAQMFNTLAASARTEGDNLRSQALDVNKWLQAPTTDVYGNQSDPNNAGAVPVAIQAPQGALRTTFDSKQDFDNYKASLTPEQRQQLRQMMGI